MPHTELLERIFMNSFILDIRQIIKKYNRDEITVYAAQASFFIVIAFFPFVMLLLSLIQFIPQISKADLLKTLVALMPDMLDSLMVGIIDDLYSSSAGTIVSITAISALWSASKGMLSIERGLNHIIGSPRKRNYIIRRIISSFYTIVFILICILSLLLLVFGNTLQNFLVNSYPIIANITRHIISLRSLIILWVLIIGFTCLYTYVPEEPLRLKHQMPGAIFCTIGWIVFSYAFSLYFNNFSNFSNMYGSLTAVVLLMLWLYFCICIIFLGAEINHHYRDSWK